MVFGVLFAVNSSLHSYLIVSYAKEDGGSLDVGFIHVERHRAVDRHSALRLDVSRLHCLAICLANDRFRTILLKKSALFLRCPSWSEFFNSVDR